MEPWHWQALWWITMFPLGVIAVYGFGYLMSFVIKE